MMFLAFCLFASCVFFPSCFVVAQPPLNAAEQEAVYGVLDSISSEVDWRSDFPEDLCTSAPHGVVCDYFDDKGSLSAHITELSFGYVSDYSPNPPCTPDSVLNASLFSPFKHLKKVFFYECFTRDSVPLPDFSPVGSSLEELVFIENPSLVGCLPGNISSLKSLRRLVLTGTNVTGKIPDVFGDLVNLEQLTISRNKLYGEITVNFGKMKNLKVVDLSQNEFEGRVPESLGTGSRELLKLDLSFNGFSGEIPETLKSLKSLEFLDLSYNHFGNFGIPLFLGEMPSLKEVYLNGNSLGGRIPEIWGNLSNILSIGLSKNGLVGRIPPSMAAIPRNLCYIGLDNNKLEGTVPEEFGSMESLRELNLANNNLSGKLPFSAKSVAQIGAKLKLQGNPQLCADEELLKSAEASLKLCNKKVAIKHKHAILHEDSNSSPPKSCNCLLCFILSIGISLLLLL